MILCVAALALSSTTQARAETIGKATPKTCSAKALRRIKSKMSMKRIIKLCGEPEKDIGSGIHIYVYELEDGSSVWVGTPDRKRIIYVTHVLPDGEKRVIIQTWMNAAPPRRARRKKGLR